MVAMKVTNQVVTERILAGRAIMDPLAEETHSIRSLPVSRVRRPRLLSRLRDGTVVDYFRLPLSVGGSTSALLQRAHAVAWRFEGERCCWCSNVFRGGSLLVVVDDGQWKVFLYMDCLLKRRQGCEDKKLPRQKQNRKKAL